MSFYNSNDVLYVLVVFFEKYYYFFNSVVILFDERYNVVLQVFDFGLKAMICLPFFGFWFGWETVMRLPFCG